MHEQQKRIPRGLADWLISLNKRVVNPSIWHKHTHTPQKGVCILHGTHTAKWMRWHKTEHNAHSSLRHDMCDKYLCVCVRASVVYKVIAVFCIPSTFEIVWFQRAPLKKWHFPKQKRNRVSIYHRLHTLFHFILFGMHVCIQHWNMIWKHIHFLSVGVLNYKSLSLTKQKYARHLSPFLSSFPFWHRVCRPFFVCSLCKYIFDKFVERCRVMAIHKCCRNKTRNKPNVPKKSGKSSHGKKNQQTCQTACVCDSFSYFSLEIESQINQIK